MEESTSREKILKKIRNGLMQKSTKDSVANIDFESNIYIASPDGPEMAFAQNFTEAGGKFLFCESNNVLIDNIDFLIGENDWQGKIVCEEPMIQTLLNLAEIDYETVCNENTLAVFSTCECLITRTGSIMISSKQGNSKQTMLVPHTKVVFAFANQLADDLKAALSLIKAKYNGNFPNLLSVITNPIHQTENNIEIYVLLIDNEDDNNRE